MGVGFLQPVWLNGKVKGCCSRLGLINPIQEANQPPPLTATTQHTVQVCDSIQA